MYLVLQPLPTFGPTWAHGGSRARPWLKTGGGPMVQGLGPGPWVRAWARRQFWPGPGPWAPMGPCGPIFGRGLKISLSLYIYIYEYL